MKNVALVILIALGINSSSVFADSVAYNGFSLYLGRSTLPEEKNVSSGLAILRSFHASEYHGHEVQVGLFDNIGPHTSNVFVALSAIGIVPLGESGYKLYGKLGVADVYSTGSSATANKFGLTYGTGIEFQREVGIIRVGLQHFSLGSSVLPHALGANLIGLTLLLE